MDVEPREVEMFARSICNSIEQDRANDFFVDSATEGKGKYYTAYVHAQCSKKNAGVSRQLHDKPEPEKFIQRYDIRST